MSLAARIILAACEKRVLETADELAKLTTEAIELADRVDAARERLEWAEMMAFEAAMAIARDVAEEESAAQDREEFCPF